MINSNHNTKRGNNSTFSSSQDTSSISQCLPLDPINLGNQKYNRSTELKRVLTAPVGNNLESYSEGLKNFKESVQDTTKKARCRAKVLEHSISKLEEFRVVKRQRTDPLSNGRSCSGNSSMDNNNNNKISNNKNITGLGPKTRIRTSMLDTRTEGRAITRQQQVLVVKNQEDITNKDDIEIEEKLPKKLPNVGGSVEIGWEKKMRRKRSVGGVNNNNNYNNSNSNNNTNICNNINDSNNNNSSNNINNNNNKRAAKGNREIKRATLVKPSGDSELQSVEAQSFRSKASAANSGITVVESSIPSIPANLSSRLTQRIELEKTLSNTEIDSPAGSLMNTNVVKNKVARTTRTNSSDKNNNNNNIIRAAPVNFEKIQKHSISMSSSSSSASHVARWGGQRPLKISRTRRSNLAFLVSNSNENQEAHPQPSDLIPQTPSVISEGEECRGGEIKSKENGSDAGEVSVIPNQKDRKNLLHPRKNKILGNKGAGEKINNLPLPKPLQSSRRIPDNTRSKSSNHRVPKNRRATVRPGTVLNYGSVDFTGESDDREQLLAAAKYARNSNNLACSSSLWKKMEHYFASITSQDASYIKDQLNLAEELNGNLSLMLDDEYNAVSVLMNQEKVNKKSVKTKSPSLYQRLLSALIEDDDNEEPYLQSEVRNISFQSASDDSHCGSCNQMETEIKERDYNNNYNNKVESEVESGADFHTHSKHAMDRNSCSNEHWQADDGFSYSSSQIDSFDHQYESLSLDDRLLMELESIGLCPVMPHLEETEELNQDITDLQASLFQQVGKMKKHLENIEKAIPDARSAERLKMEQAAMNQLVEMAYKRRMAYRGNESSKTVIRRVSKQAGLAFTRRTLDRCHKFEETGKSCFTDPAIQDFLFSAPSLPKNRKEKTPPQKNPDVSNNKQKAQGRTTHPTGPFSRGLGQPETPVIDDLGGPQVDTDLMSSLLDFEEDGLLDDDCLGGLEIPMDDLTDLQMLM